MRKISPISQVLVLVAAAMMISVYFTPLWQISLWAPQYPEGLNMKIWIDQLSGDVDIINGVNHYIGMKHISAEMFPEFTFLKYIVGGIIAFGFLAGIFAKRWTLYTFFGLMVLLGIGVLIDMYRWGYEYGHNLDPKAAIKVPGMSYQPPLIGYKELLNFIAYSGPDTGGWILSAAAVLVAIAVFLEIRRKRKTYSKHTKAIIS